MGRVYWSFHPFIWLSLVIYGYIFRSLFIVHQHLKKNREKAWEKREEEGSRLGLGKEVFPAASWRFPARSRLGGGGSS